MADLTVLQEISHLWGQDLNLGPTGDLGLVTRTERSRQRVLRRLLTAPGSYLFQPDYGAGIPQMIGKAIDLAKIKARIEGQMKLEPSVAQNPPPVATVIQITGGVQAKVQYMTLPDKQPVSLSFAVNT